VSCAIDKVFRLKCDTRGGAIDLSPSAAGKVRREAGFTVSVIVMVRYIENVDTSFRYRYMESYRSAASNIDLTSACRQRPILFLAVDFTFLDSNAGSKEFSYHSSQND